MYTETLAPADPARSCQGECLARQVIRAAKTSRLSRRRCEFLGRQLAVLVELTECLEEMEKQTTVIKEARDWLALPKLSTNPADVERRCNAGIEVFRKYKNAMKTGGLIALPARGR